MKNTKKQEIEEDGVASVSANTSPTATTKVLKTTKRKKMETIREGKTWKLYKDGEHNIFEFFEADDFMAFKMGMTRSSSSHWRLREATTEFLAAMVEHRSTKNLTVKFEDQHMNPCLNMSF
jgi:hypothetical protein